MDFLFILLIGFLIFVAILSVIVRIVIQWALTHAAAKQAAELQRQLEFIARNPSPGLPPVHFPPPGGGTVMPGTGGTTTTGTWVGVTPKWKR